MTTRRCTSHVQLVKVVVVLVSLCCLIGQSTAFSSADLAQTQHYSPLFLLKNPSRSNGIFRRDSHNRLNTTPSFNDSIYRSFRRDTKLQAFPLPDVWVTSVLPPFLGLIKSEWGVSYGYGLAVTLSALNILYRTSQPNPIATCQAAALIFFGLRLSLFLFIRTRLSERMKEFEKSIEERAVARGSRAKRLPFILSCGFLYFGLICPLILVSQLPMSYIPDVALDVVKVLVTGQWFGYLLATLGDVTKTYVKVKNKDERYLVTEGIFSLLRHPNYTGEIVAWTCNALAGALSGAYILRAVRPISPSVIVTLATTVLGCSGILFVLLRATSNLEKKQRTEYGGSSKYQAWIDSTWSGWTMSDMSSKPSTVDEDHEVSMDAETDEESGSGI